MLERLAATDAAGVKSDADLQYAQAIGLGYQGITANVGNGDRSKNPFGEDARLRRAFSLAIDREALNQVAFEGVFAPGNQPFPPNSQWYDTAVPIQALDLAKANALLTEAGHATLDIDLQDPNNPVPTPSTQTDTPRLSPAAY